MADERGAGESASASDPIYDSLKHIHTNKHTRNLVYQISNTLMEDQGQDQDPEFTAIVSDDDDEISSFLRSIRDTDSYKKLLREIVRDVMNQILKDQYKIYLRKIRGHIRSETDTSRLIQEGASYFRRHGSELRARDLESLRGITNEEDLNQKLRTIKQKKRELIERGEKLDERTMIEYVHGSSSQFPPPPPPPPPPSSQPPPPSSRSPPPPPPSLAGLRLPPTSPHPPYPPPPPPSRPSSSRKTRKTRVKRKRKNRTRNKGSQ